MLVVNGHSPRGNDLFAKSPKIAVPELPEFLVNNSAVVILKPSIEFTSGK